MRFSLSHALMACYGVLGTFAVPAIAQTMPSNQFWVETLDLNAVAQDYGKAHAGQSADSQPLTLDGKVYPHGFGTHANSTVSIDLHGSATRFTATVGVDDEKKGMGSVDFHVIVDGKEAAKTSVLHGGDKPQLLSVDLTGAKTLILRVGDGGDGIDNDHADWGDATITLISDTAKKPSVLALPVEPARLIIPPADPKPAIHGPQVTGATPGHAFLFMISATGDGPLIYSAKNLPAGLTLDSKTGIISGSLRKDGVTKVTLTARGPKGTAKRDLTIIGGKHKLAQTPPMGWNSWNVWAGNVDQDKVKAAADVMISSGLAAHGYQYVNIDDTWEAKRDASGNILTNQKFPDMKALADYVHSKGLKIGIYSSPGPQTCANYEGSYQHEDQDAASYAAWEMDYVKYDWCSYGKIAAGAHDLDTYKKPYAVMAASLDKAPRDIVYSFCQYGMGDVWQWGESLNGNAWRTTGDINDSWNSMHGILESQNGHEAFAGPGHWNDPDMLVVGTVGWGRTHPSRLTQNEQITHISMWSMLSSPLLIGCDMTILDEFTRAVLTNDEVLDIDQDPLGKPAGRKIMNGTGEIWARPLADGSTAIALVNVGAIQTITVKFADLALSPTQRVRDLWLHKDLGTIKDSYSVEVPTHGTVLLKVSSGR